MHTRNGPLGARLLRVLAASTVFVAVWVAIGIVPFRAGNGWAASPWWLPAGLSLALVLSIGARAWPLLFAAGVAFELLLLPDVPLLSVLLARAALATVYTAAGLALLRLHVELRRGTLRDLALFFAVGVLAAPAALAVLHTVVFVGTGALPAAQALPFARTFAIGDALGVLVAAPLFATDVLPRARGLYRSPWQLAPTLACVAAAAASGALLFLQLTRTAGPYDLLGFVLLPPIVVAARWGYHWAIVAVPSAAVVIAATHWLAAPGVGAEGIQTLTASLAVATLCLGAAVTRLHLSEARLAHDALHDSLTGLPNRLLFLDRLGHALARGDRGRPEPVVFFLDLDRFKVVNDSLGHTAGDRLLRAVGTRLAAQMRPTDTVARLGGDEFAVLVDDASTPGRVAGIAERLRTAFLDAFDVGGSVVGASASIGIARGGEADGTPEGILRHADIAMYRAKEQGPGRVEIFDAQMRRAVSERLDTEVALHRALDHDELFVVYQPIVSIADGVVVGLEALLRWRANGVPLAAESFISIAEDSGLIVPIGDWVLDEVARQAKAWRWLPGHTASPIAIHVNLSARQLSAPQLVAGVGEAVHMLADGPFQLCLEVTESVLMSDPEQALRQLARLDALGASISVDDFGTGYSSLSYLERLPASSLKIDKSFVSRLAAGTGSDAIVAAVVTLAHTLGLTVVAEGVETASQLDLLRDLGCDSVQGFHLSRPLPPEEASLLLA